MIQTGSNKAQTTVSTLEPCTAQEWNERAYQNKKAWHKQQAQLPIKEKMRIMLQMQRDALPLIARHRPLKPHEKPWDIEP